MKDKLIQTAGKLWNELGAQGQCSVYDLSRFLKEDEEVINLAIGWLMREDKVSCSKKKRDYVYSLVDSELRAFQDIYGDGMPKKRKSFWRRKFLS